MTTLHGIVRNLGAPGLSETGRVRADQDGRLQADGPAPGNVFTRAWNCLTRNEQQLAENKHTARAFVTELRARYGGQVADMASHQLKAHLKHGRPLTGRRMECILERTSQMRTRNAAGNMARLDQLNERIVNNALRVAFGAQSWPACVQDRAGAKNAMLEAIVSNEDFMRQSFEGDEETFVQHFSGIGAKVLEDFVHRSLMSASMRLADQMIDPDVPSSSETKPMQLASAFGLNGQQQTVLNQQWMFLLSVTDHLAVVPDEGPAGDMLSVCLGMVGSLGEQANACNALPGRLADALRADMADLRAILLDQLGLREATDEQIKGLLQANRALSALEHNFTEGGWLKVIEGADQRLEGLRSIETRLSEISVEQPSAQPLMRKLFERNHVFTEGLTNLVDDARYVGVTPDALAALRDARVEGNAEMFSRLGVGAGFTGVDIEWLARNGLPIGETLARFSSNEVRLLHEHGVSIGLALQYLEREVPIHPRTMVTDFNENRIVNAPQRLHGGAVSETWKINFGGVATAFKTAQSGIGDGAASVVLGIDPKDARMAVRNIATRIVDELLGFDLVPQTAMATHGGSLGVAMAFVEGKSALAEVGRKLDEGEQAQYASWLAMVEEGDLDEATFGVLMQSNGIRIENGVPIKSETHSVLLDFNDPGLSRELVKLQLLDALTAQGDRHGGNYLARFSPQGEFLGVGAIDNDQAFGTLIEDPEELQKSARSVFNGVALPSVVDAGIKRVFDELEPASLRAALTDLLPTKEIDAALKRLEAIRVHLGDPEKTLVLDENDDAAWTSKEARERLEDPNRSYVGRDRLLRESLPILGCVEEFA